MIESAVVAGSMALHLPSHVAGASNGAPASLPGHGAAFARNVPEGEQRLPDGEHEHGGVHVTVLGGASR